MHNLPVPEYTINEFLDACLSKDKPSLKDRFSQNFDTILIKCEFYNNFMIGQNGHNIDHFEESYYSPLTKEDLKWLYKKRLLKQSSDGRRFYNKLLVKSKKRSCCYCSFRDPTELDHFLPIGKYSQYSIFPNNLIPVCSHCNKLKLTFSPTNKLENLIHPYFENYDDHYWLQSRIQYFKNTPVAEFYVKCDHIGEDVVVRLGNHLNKIQLFQRYSSQASRELCGAVGKFKKAFAERGSLGLKGDLIEEAESRAAFHRNSWQSALYRGLSNDQRFLNLDWSISEY